GVQLDGRSVTARIFDSVGTVALKSALETAGYVFPETSRTLVQIMDELESNPETSLARMDALASQMAELEQAAGITEEVLPDPDSTESAPPSEVPENTPTGDINIFGRYTVVTTAEDGGTDTMTVTLSDQGGGRVQWTHEDDEDDEDDDFTNMLYDQSTHTLHYEEGTWTVNVTFVNSAGTVKGRGYMSGILWEQPFKVALDFTKTSD
ncbi:MAG: hypothetical protein K6U74_21555, partial [Firmicutes bacterium]|nr:hypothetical protein [Bacillota bacterium]